MDLVVALVAVAIKPTPGQPNSMELSLIIGISLVGIIFGVILADAIMRFTFQHQITGVGLEIALFGKIPLKRIPFSNIVEVRKVSFKETLSLKNFFGALRFGIFRLRHVVVLVRLKEGIRIFPFPDIYGRKILFLFPDDPDGFIQKVLPNVSQEPRSL